MPAGVEQHVGEGVPDFPRCAQDARVKSLREHPTAVIGRPVDCARDARANGHHAARESARVGGLDEKVSVRGLQGVVDEPEVAAVTSGRKAVFQRTNDRHRAQ